MDNLKGGDMKEQTILGTEEAWRLCEEARLIRDQASGPVMRAAFNSAFSSNKEELVKAQTEFQEKEGLFRIAWEAWQATRK